MATTFQQAGAPPAMQTKQGDTSIGKTGRVEAPSDQPDAKKARSLITSDAFISMLCATKAEQVRNKDNAIFVCTRDDKLVDVWTGLVRHGFLSCPVVDRKYEKYFGFVDMLDILTFILDKFGKSSLETSDDWWSLVREDERLQEATVRTVMQAPLSFRNPFHPILRGFSLFSAFEVLARVPGAHRVPVIDEQRRLYCVLTHSHMLRVLHRNIEAGLVPQEVAQKPVARMTVSMKPVVTATVNEKAIDAFRRLVTQHIAGLAVIDEQGRIVGALSQRDIKAVSTDGRMFYRLFLPLREYLNISDPQRPREPVTVTADDTMATAVRRMVEHRIHRIFVEKDRQPIGCVSIKDVFFEVIEDPTRRTVLIDQ